MLIDGAVTAGATALTTTLMPTLSDPALFVAVTNKLYVPGGTLAAMVTRLFVVLRLKPEAVVPNELNVCIVIVMGAVPVTP